ncbi:MAG TPA: hypothetical protein VKY54_09155, partial [Kiloniellales bacterium]|nr:hypothetical protein [Kiloniellales bacterium]
MSVAQLVEPARLSMCLDVDPLAREASGQRETQVLEHGVSILEDTDDAAPVLKDHHHVIGQ